MMEEFNTEAAVLFFGKRYRKVIEDSIKWLSVQEKEWELPTPINKWEFIRSLIERIPREYLVINTQDTIGSAERQGG
jgi:hypothetical protein